MEASPQSWDAKALAHALGGEASGSRIKAPAPGHSSKDRSLSIELRPDAPDGFICHSFAGDDDLACKDYVRRIVGLPGWKPSAGQAAAGIKLFQPAKSVSPDRKDRPAEREPFNDGWLIRDGWKQTAVYSYYDESSHLFDVCRYEKAGEEKRFLRRHFHEGTWFKRSGTDLRPLYRAADLSKVAHDIVFVCEGEKDADRLAGLGFVAVTAASGAWEVDTIEPLRGRVCYILEDNDEAGRKKALASAMALHRVASEVRIVSIPGLAEKEDVSDWLDWGGDHNRLVDIAKATPIWELPSEETAAAIPVGLPFTCYGDIQTEVRKPWLVKGVIAEGETSAWIGPPGGGKSALLTDIAFHTASGRDWRGRRHKKRCSVLYLAFERGDLLKRRLLAYKQEFGDTQVPIAVATAPVDLMQPGSVQLLIETLRGVADRLRLPVGMMVLDTYAKAVAYGGGDENSAKDQNTVLGNLRLVQAETGVHVALVGHTGKDENRGARGSNAFLGDVDVMVQIEGDDVKVAKITKANDQPEGALTTFTLETYSFGQDEDGDEITTAIVARNVPASVAGDAVQRFRMTARDRLAMRMLRESIDDAGEPAPTSNHIPHGVRVVSTELWRRYCYQGGIASGDSTPDAKRKAFSRAVGSLQSQGFIGQWEPHVWIAKEPDQ